MKSAKTIAMLVTVFACITMVNRLQAQNGSNAVCNGGTLPTGISCSSAFIDASTLSGSDICAKINTALGLIPSVGGVIDARGVGSGTNQSCAASPWNGISSPGPSYILLPSGSITIPSTWFLPNETRIFGEGRGGPNVSGTTLAAKSGFTTGTPMIQFGSSTLCPSGVCFGISVQDLMLDGVNQDVIGIENLNSQELTYVQRVNLYQITGTGLQVGNSTNSNQSQNSGPYSDITFAPGSSATSTTVCAQLYDSGDTRGIQGMTCTADGTPSAAILVDGNGNLLENIHIEGFVDGILVGSNNSAGSNVILNVTGSNGSGAITNVVHISSSHTVDDLSMLAIANAGATNTIKDDETSTTLTDASVGVYELGRSVGTTGYSRFTTSPSAPTWGFGTSAPTGSCSTGSIFTRTNGTSVSTTLYLCVNGSWVGA